MPPLPQPGARDHISPVILNDTEHAYLKGEAGPAMKLAMELVLQAARILDAKELVPVRFAHLDSCFYAGVAHVDFARFCLEHGARFSVPAWTNNGVVSLTHPQHFDGHHDVEMTSGAADLMHLYEEMGAKPVFTCAPYQLPAGPELGDHIVVGESNAVSYYNAVVGARTNKYGDYLDVACALVGKAPRAGLHTDEGRKATLAFDVSRVPEALRETDIFHHLLGHHVGRIAGRGVPVISGLIAGASRDDLKALSTAVASSGGVELWHGVAITPEAPTLDAVFESGDVHHVSASHLAAAQRDLSRALDGPLDRVALGTPHFSASEFRDLRDLLDGRKVSVPLTITSSRFVISYIAGKGWLDEFTAQGVEIVGDICSYYNPGMVGLKGRVMTNSAKWAYYAPGMLPVEVCFGSLRECAESAVRGEVWRDPALWGLLS